MLTNYGDGEKAEKKVQNALRRIYTLRDMGYDPYVMIYDKPNAPREIQMHWILDVTFSEDDCRFLSENAHKSMNALRKFALAVHKNFLAAHHTSIKASMLSALLDSNLFLTLLDFYETDVTRSHGN